MASLEHVRLVLLLLMIPKQWRIRLSCCVIGLRGFAITCHRCRAEYPREISHVVNDATLLRFGWKVRQQAQVLQ